MSKLLDTAFGHNLHSMDIDTFLQDKIDKKLSY